MVTAASAANLVKYPCTDGEPMAETPVHRDATLDLIAMLKARYLAEPGVYVSGNMMMYYVEGDPEKWIAPDVFVTFGIPKLPEREIYQTWREGKGPDVVIEVTSRSTARTDQRWKFALYRDKIKVREYFLFDPREETLAGVSLIGYRRIGRVYQPIPKTAGRLASKLLGLQLEASGAQLKLYDPRRAAYLLTPAEMSAALEQESVARAVAEAEVKRLKREIEELRRVRRSDRRAGDE
jgi:Uma2 family endonuclease